MAVMASDTLMFQFLDFAFALELASSLSVFSFFSKQQPEELLNILLIQQVTIVLS